MNNIKPKLNRNNERGAARLNLVLLIVVVGLLLFAGYHFLPVYYEGVTMKEEMDAAVMRGLTMASANTPEQVVRSEINVDLDERGVPRDALVQLTAKDKAVTATVSYSKLVPILPFGLYDYNYVFTYTATPSY